MTDEPKTTRRTCSACQIAYINGVRCHESGCPESWRDEVRSCRNCGDDFHPDERFHAFCSESCTADFYGMPTPDDDLNLAEADEISDDDLEAASDFYDQLEWEQNQRYEPITGSYTDNNPQ